MFPTDLPPVPPPGSELSEREARYRYDAAVAQLHQREIELASLDEPEWPRVPLVAAGLVALPIALTFTGLWQEILVMAFRLHPRDELIASFAAGLATAAPLVAVTLAHARQPRGPLGGLWVTAALAVGLGAALVVLRIGIATTPEEVWLAIGLGLLESFLVLLLERLGTAYHAAWEEHRERSRAAEEATRHTEVAARLVARRHAELAGVIEAGRTAVAYPPGGLLRGRPNP